MKRANRLRRPDQFQRVRREGRTFHHHLLLLNVATNRRKHTRCGIVVSKRVGKAVQRNRARRRIREAVRLVFDHIVVGVDLVFIVRTVDVAEVSFTVLQSTIEHLLRRAGLWQESIGTTAQQPSIVAES